MKVHPFQLQKYVSLFSPNHRQSPFFNPFTEYFKLYPKVEKWLELIKQKQISHLPLKFSLSPFCLYIYLSLLHSLPISISPCLSISLSSCLSTSLYLSLFLSLSLSLSHSSSLTHPLSLSSLPVLAVFRFC